MTRVPTWRERALPYEGLPSQEALLWEMGVMLAALLASALVAGLLAQW